MKLRRTVITDRHFSDAWSHPDIVFLKHNKPDDRPPDQWQHTFRLFFTSFAERRQDLVLLASLGRDSLDQTRSQTRGDGRPRRIFPPG